MALVDNDPESLSFYAQKLRSGNLEVVSFISPADLEQQIWGKSVNALIYSLAPSKLSGDLVFLAKFISKFSDVPVITISSTMQEKDLDAIMRAGIRMHINRDLSHPRDLLVALEQIL